ncbi:hypothetical protein CBS101457_000925 [Exobasidium rhododendri]|nr:hypothetical protein CBS101457_000925 [Exobasidium rhododendri]
MDIKDIKWRRLCVPRQQLFDVFKTVAPPHFAVLLLTILVLITPVARAIGQDAYLVITYLHLFFYPHGPVGEHVEKVVLHLSTCAFGLAISFLTVCGTVWIDGGESQVVYRTTGAKVLGACVLVLLCFFGGLCQSLYPRIKMAIRILLFSSTWTICSGATVIQSSIFTNQFYVAALSAGVSLLANFLLFPKFAQDDFAVLLVKTYSVKRTLLEQAVTDFFQEHAEPADARKPSERLILLRGDVLDKCTELKLQFERARLELNYGHLDVNEAKPLVAMLLRTKGWFSCGMGLGTKEGSDHMNKDITSTDSASSSETPQLQEKRIELDTLKPCIYRLLEAITSSISIVEASVELCMRGGSPRKVKDDERWNILYQVDSQTATKKPSLTLLRQRHKMERALEAFKEDLAGVLKHLAATTSTKKADGRSDNIGNGKRSDSSDVLSGTALFHSDVYDVAFLMISMMEIAKEVEGALVSCQTMIAVWHSHPMKRFWLPFVSAHFWWMKKLSAESESAAIFDHDLLEEQQRDVHLFTREEQAKEKSGQGDGIDFIKQMSHRSNVVYWRIRLSTALLTLKRSNHIRYGVKLAGGVALLSLPCWLTEARAWFVSQRGVWLIVTYIWVLETSTGATIQVSVFRTIGTITSAVYAIAAWYICDQGNKYGVAFFIVLAQAPASYFIIYTKRAQSLGLVFGFTQSVILLVHLLAGSSGSSSSDESILHLALVRGYQILLGIVAAFLVNIFLWPLHARVYLIQTLSHITRQCGKMYLSLAKQMLSQHIIIGPETNEKFVKLEESIQSELVASRDYLEIMHIEISLIPKPIHTLSLVVKTLQRIADLLALLRKCREVSLRIIRKEACFNVLNLRKELVSSILLSLWIIGQSLTTKERLPQFLPSCRSALEELTEAMREQIDQNNSHQLHKEGDNAMRLSKPSQGDLIPSPSPIRTSLSSARLHGRGHTATSLTPPSPSTPRPQSQRPRKTIDYSYFFVFAEHSLLSEIIFEVEKLLFLTRLLVGERNFIDSDYLPNHYGGHQQDHFNPNKSLHHLDDLNAFHHSMSEHGIDGRRLASQLEKTLKAAKETIVP